jgi:hypothetical protein
MSMAWMARLGAWALAPAALAASPSSAQQPFDVDVDCSGAYAPGDDVPFVVALSENAARSHAVEITVTMTAPTLGTSELLHTTLTLTARRELSIARDLGLPGNAPPGDYAIDVVASDGRASLSDGCAFTVAP